MIMKENKLNIAELLKDCPKGMELDCALYDNVFFDGIDTNDDNFPISLYYKHNNIKNGFSVTKYGTYNNHQNTKCIIFPKGKTTWEGFQRPFKDGDVITWEDRGSLVACIYKERKNIATFNHHIALYKYGGGIVVNGEIVLTDDELRFATEEEKQKLFDTIKANGYKWNSETKSLDKLAEPRFKVGDRIKAICNNNQYDIKELTDTHYTLVEVEYKFKYIEPISEDKNWELVPNKFDVTTLKPFDKVLVRYTKYSEWSATFFSHYDKDFERRCYPFVTTSSKSYSMCIPYEGNEHLLGTTNDCDESYKTWE